MPAYGQWLARRRATTTCPDLAQTTMSWRDIGRKRPSCEVVAPSDNQPRPIAACASPTRAPPSMPAYGQWLARRRATTTCPDLAQTTTSWRDIGRRWSFREVIAPSDNQPRPTAACASPTRAPPSMPAYGKWPKWRAIFNEKAFPQLTTSCDVVGSHYFDLLSKVELHCSVGESSGLFMFRCRRQVGAQRSPPVLCLGRFTPLTADKMFSSFPVSQLGHLKALLDSKAGQEDLTSITKAMGDVEETLTVVRESIPGQTALLELQVKRVSQLQSTAESERCHRWFPPPACDTGRFLVIWRSCTIAAVLKRT